ncbi:hypothetical protein [Acetivibrio cellulolyticus]|uniref:hypothetical protein n=1 Tax=Acetivibrio cellulolyticus TaxID=35830 RepID=UPI0001E2C1B7|nr:hypothetical protein [Acetivibrio cellulolyticus]
MLRDKYSLTFIMGVVLQSSYVIGVAITNISTVDSYSMARTLYAPPICLSYIFMIIGLLGMFGVVDKFLNKFKKSK